MGTEGKGKPGKGVRSPDTSVRAKIGERNKEQFKEHERASEEAERAGAKARSPLRAVDKKIEPRPYDPRKFRIPAHDDGHAAAQYGYKASPRYGGIMTEIIYSRTFPELTNPGYFQRAAIHHFIEYLQEIHPSQKVQSALAELALINQMIEEEEQLLHLIATVEKLSKLVDKYKALGLIASAQRVAFQARTHVEAMPQKDKEIKEYLAVALKEKFADLYSPSQRKRGKNGGKEKAGLLAGGSDEADEHEIASAQKASETLAEIYERVRAEDETSADERDAEEPDGDDEGWVG